MSLSNLLNRPWSPLYHCHILISPFHNSSFSTNNPPLFWPFSRRIRFPLIISLSSFSFVFILPQISVRHSKRVLRTSRLHIDEQLSSLHFDCTALSHRQFYTLVGQIIHIAQALLSSCVVPHRNSHLADFPEPPGDSSTLPFMYMKTERISSSVTS